MPATNAKEKLIDQFSSQQVRTTPRSVFLVSTFFVLALLLGCGPSASQGDGTGSAADPASSDMPELTDDVIRERINDVRVRQIPDENGTAEPISWRFDEEEPKEIKVVEKQVEGNRATITLDIKTESSPRARELRSRPRYLAGQIRTQWELRTGWVLRKWEIVNTENISMKYRDLPKAPAQNPDR